MGSSGGVGRSPGTYLDRAGSHLRPLPIILRRCQQPKVPPTHYLHFQIDLKLTSASPPWESFGRAFGTQGDPKMTPREPQVSPQEASGNHRKPPGSLPGTFQKRFQQSPQQTTPISQHLSGVKLPIARLWRPVCYTFYRTLKRWTTGTLYGGG